MTPLRLAIAILVAFLVLLIGGCVLFGAGTNEEGDLDDLLTTPTRTTTTTQTTP